MRGCLRGWTSPAGGLAWWQPAPACGCRNDRLPCGMNIDVLPGILLAGAVAVAAIAVAA